VNVKTFGALAGAALVAIAVWAVAAHQLGRPVTPVPDSPGGGGIADAVLHHPGSFLSYTWQVFLPRLPFMTNLVGTWPAFDIYIIGGWANFGWALIQFPRWVYYVITAVGLLCLPLGILAIRRYAVAARARWLEL